MGYYTRQQYRKRSEATEQETVIQWCGWHERKHPELKLIFHIPNGGSRNTGAGILCGGMLWGRGSRTVDCKLFEYGRLSGIRTGRKGGMNYADTKSGNAGIYTTQRHCFCRSKDCGGEAVEREEAG